MQHLLTMLLPYVCHFYCRWRSRRCEVLIVFCVERRSKEGPPVPSETTTSPQNTQKQNLKDFTMIDRESNTLHHRAKGALHIRIKDPSLNRNIGKVRIPSVLNKLLKAPRHLELSHSSILPPKGGTFFTWSLNTKDN